MRSKSASPGAYRDSQVFFACGGCPIQRDMRGRGSGDLRGDQGELHFSSATTLKRELLLRLAYLVPLAAGVNLFTCQAINFI